MANLYENIINMETTGKEENEKILSAYDKVLREQYFINEDSTEDALKTLQAILKATKGKKGEAEEIFDMALGMKMFYDKNKGFSRGQAQWIYKTSEAMFNKK